LRQGPAAIVLFGIRGIERPARGAYIQVMNAILEIPMIRRAPTGVQARLPAA
jgi:hypothetical protein